MSIIIGCPVRNRDWVLPKYLDHLYRLDYNKKDIILCFLVNDSRDQTLELLRQFSNEHILEYKEIIIAQKRYDFPDCDRDFGRDATKLEHFSIVRNDWVELFKGLSGIEYVFSVDSDVLIPPQALNKLIKNDKDICSLLVNNSVHNRGYGEDITNMFIWQYESWQNYTKYPKDEVVKVDVTGSAYLIKRSVLNRVDYKPHPLGEDFGFCIYAKQMEYEVFCDTSICSEHIMQRN